MATPIQQYREKFGSQNPKSPVKLTPLQEYRKKRFPVRNDITNAFSGRTSNRSLKTSGGLYNIAVRNGLKPQADKIVALNQGEETKKIFSGGRISDIFDVLNALDYGVVGVLKGKSFSEGIKTRQSFSDPDSLGADGIPGAIVGLALDIAVDPLTYAGGLGVLPKVSKLVGLTKLARGAKALTFGKRVTKAIDTGSDVAKSYEAVEGGTRLGKYLATKASYMFGADPIFRETFERSARAVAVGTQNIVKLGKSVAGLAPQTASKILAKDATGRFIRRPLKELVGTLKPEELAPVTKLYQTIDQLGKEAVDLGLLSQSKYEENLGQYIKNAYTEYEQAKNKNIFGMARVGIKGIKKRVEGLTTGRMAELGQIDNPAYLLFKSAFDLTRDVENAKLFRAVSQRFGTEVAQEGFTKLPTGTRLGDLAGKYVPDNMALYLNEIIREAPEGWNLAAQKAVAAFKYSKVILNPATHARNVISNKILNYWKLGMNPLDPRVILAEKEALKEIRPKWLGGLGGVGKWSDEARPLGYDLDTFASQEMRVLLDSPEASAWGKGFGKTWNTVKNKIADIYQAEENEAKLTAYIFNRKYRKLNPEDAWKAAESATFNYAQVTPFVRKLREHILGFPFITFTVKSTPVVAETIVKNPQRVSIVGKIKQSIESLSNRDETDRERASEPGWIKNGFYVKLPGKDSKGRSNYFDLTYILPFGELIAGNFFEGATSRKTGLQETTAETISKKSALFGLVSELVQNEDFYGNRVYNESDPDHKRNGDIMRHVLKAIAPPLISDLLPGGYDDSGERVVRGIRGAITKGDEKNQQRTVLQEMFRMIGAKVQPIDADIQEIYQELNTKKGLQTLLRENGILGEYNINYLKDEDEDE